MSIFLLISIGSVCAADDSANAIADSGSDVALSDGEPTEKIDTEIIADDEISINEGETAESVVLVKNKDDNSNITVTKENLTVLHGNKAINFTYENTKLTITEQLAAGEYNLLIKYLGNENFTSSNQTLLLKVYGNASIQAPNSVNVNSSDIVKIPLNVTNGVELFDVTKNDLNVTLTYKDGNVTKTVHIDEINFENGVLSFTVNRNITSGTITVTYLDETSKNITFKRIVNARIDIINNVVEYKNGYFIVRLVDVDDETNILANKKVTLTFKGNVQAGFSGTTNATGYANWDAKNLYTFNFDGSTIDAKPLEIKTYTVTVADNDDSYIASTVNANLTVNPADVVITIPDFKKTYGTTEPVKIIATFKSSGKPVVNEVVKINVPKSTQKVLYALTDENGTAKLTVSGLTGGEYDISATMNDTTKLKSNSTANKIIIVKKEVKLSTNDVSIYYNSGTTATLKVLDKTTGKAVPNAIVKITIKSGSKNVFVGWVQTNSKGEASLTTPLAVGKYKITISMDENEPRYKASSVTKTITVLKHNARFYAPYTTAYYKEGKYFTVKLISNKNNKVIYDGKLKVRIYTSSSQYYQYIGYTNIEGKVNIKIDLNPGVYTVYVNGLDGKNYTVSQLKTTIKVLKTPAKITPNKLTAKYKANKYFTAKVINSKTGKAIAGLKIGFKVYTGKSYKVYYAVTNSNGVAQISTKALSVGSHTVQLYSTNKYCTASVATSTIKIVK